jgi:cytidyltransferase-like protein
MMNRLDYVRNKILQLEEAQRLISGWRIKGDSIVFTNGCFDILHQGHVTYLAQAASEGNRLVVGVNTDSSVKRLGKGDDRPINDELSRALVLASLGFVDLVILFDDDTPIEMIKKYIVGSDIVRSNGGRVVAIPFVEGFSTTSIIQKAKG